DQIDVLLQRNNLALFFEAGGSGRARSREQSLTRGNSKNGGNGSEFLKSGILKMTADDSNLFGIAQVGLLQNENDVFQPTFLHKSEKVPRRLRPGVNDGKNEEHEIGSGHEFFGNALMLRHHRVGPGRIDDIEVAQEIDRKKALDQLGGDIDFFFHLAI